MVGMAVIKNGVIANKIITFVTKFSVQLVHALVPNVRTIALFIIVSLTYKKGLFCLFNKKEMWFKMHFFP